MVLRIEHVRGFEFGPLDFMEIEAPYDCHHEGKGRFTLILSIEGDKELRVRSTSLFTDPRNAFPVSPSLQVLKIQNTQSVVFAEQRT